MSYRKTRSRSGQRQLRDQGLGRACPERRTGTGTGSAERAPKLGAKKSSPAWTRTMNLPVNSRLLCQLSYGGPLVAATRVQDARASVATGFSVPVLGYRLTTPPRRGQDGPHGQKGRTMRGKLMFITGLGVGYVLGTRAGREKFDKIVAQARKVWESLTVQEAAGVAQAQANRLYDQGKTVVSNQVHKMGKKNKALSEGGTGEAATGSDAESWDEASRRSEFP